MEQEFLILLVHRPPHKRRAIWVWTNQARPLFDMPDLEFQPIWEISNTFAYMRSKTVCNSYISAYMHAYVSALSAYLRLEIGEILVKWSE